MADSEGAIAPAEPSDTPPPATWRIGRVAVAGSLVVSAAIHLVLIAPALVLGSRLLQSGPAQSVTVDLVTSDELAAIAQKPEPPKPQQPPPTPAQSEAPMPQVASAADAFAMPFLPPPVPAAPEPALGRAEQLATLVGAPSVMDKDGGASDYRANLTAGEITAFATHVQSCWTAPPGLAKDVYVIVRVNLRRDGSLMTEPALQGGSASKAAMALALADSARSALRKCTPFAALPAAKYDEWRVLDLRFTPTGISTAGTVSDGPPTPG